jgi:hypothetical protein
MNQVETKSEHYARLVTWIAIARVLGCGHGFFHDLIDVECLSYIAAHGDLGRFLAVSAAQDYQEIPSSPGHCRSVKVVSQSDEAPNT